MQAQTTLPAPRALIPPLCPRRITMMDVVRELQAAGASDEEVVSIIKVWIHKGWLRPIGQFRGEGL